MHTTSLQPVPYWGPWAPTHAEGALGPAPFRILQTSTPLYLSKHISKQCLPPLDLWKKGGTEGRREGLDGTVSILVWSPLGQPALLRLGMYSTL